jgi:hypothetical protein
VFIEQFPCGVVDITSNPFAGYTPPLDSLTPQNGRNPVARDGQNYLVIFLGTDSCSGAVSLRFWPGLVRNWQKDFFERHPDAILFNSRIDDLQYGVACFLRERSIHPDDSWQCQEVISSVLPESVRESRIDDLPGNFMHLAKYPA